MDLDLFLAPPKWDLLKILAERPSSPIEIAEITKTTVSYVSQQLKLLEAIGVVEKTKTGAFEKGKPRSVYSVREDFVYFTVLSKNFADKKKLILTEHNKIVMRIWMLENHVFHLPLERFFLHIDGLLPNVSAVYCNILSNEIDLKIICDEKVRSKIEAETKKLDAKARVFFLTKDGLSKTDLDSLYTLFDPEDILKTGREKLKGGNEK